MRMAKLLVVSACLLLLTSLMALAESHHDENTPNTHLGTGDLLFRDIFGGFDSDEDLKVIDNDAVSNVRVDERRPDVLGGIFPTLDTGEGVETDVFLDNQATVAVDQDRDESVLNDLFGSDIFDRGDRTAIAADNDARANIDIHNELESELFGNNLEDIFGGRDRDVVVNAGNDATMAIATRRQQSDLDAILGNNLNDILGGEDDVLIDADNDANLNVQIDKEENAFNEIFGNNFDDIFGDDRVDVNVDNDAHSAINVETAEVGDILGADLDDILGTGDRGVDVLTNNDANADIRVAKENGGQTDVNVDNDAVLGVDVDQESDDSRTNVRVNNEANVFVNVDQDLGRGDFDDILGTRPFGTLGTRTFDDDLIVTPTTRLPTTLPVHDDFDDILGTRPLGTLGTRTFDDDLIVTPTTRLPGVLPTGVHGDFQDILGINPVLGLPTTGVVGSDLDLLRSVVADVRTVDDIFVHERSRDVHRILEDITHRDLDDIFLRRDGVLLQDALRVALDGGVVIQDVDDVGRRGAFHDLFGRIR